MIVFDLDGTLIDLDVPIEAVRAEVRAFFRHRGHDAEMRPILTAIAAAAAEVAGSDDERAALVREARGLIDDAEVRATASARLLSGLEGVAALPAPLGLLTNNSRACAQAACARLEALGIRFDAVITRDDVALAKPDPEGLTTLWRAAAEPARMTLVGDSILDVEAGCAFRRQHRCELEIIGVLGGRSGRGELSSAGADRVIADLREFASRPHHR